MRIFRCVAAASLLLWLSAVARAVATDDTFTIAVIPDTQNYVDYTHQKAEGFPFDASQQFLEQMAYIAANVENAGGDIAFVTALGDLWQHGTLLIDPVHEKRGFKRAPNHPRIEPFFAPTPKTESFEMPLVKRGYELLAGKVPFSVLAGNHDFDAQWTDARFPPDPESNGPGALGVFHVGGVGNFSRVFGPDSAFFHDRDWYVGGHDGGADSAQMFTAGGYRFLHIALQFDAPNASLQWAADIVERFPGLPTIVSTHRFILANGERASSGGSGDNSRADPQDNNPQMIWDKFVSRYDQIFMILSGHYEGANLRIERNRFGHSVYQLLSDYQYRKQTAKAAGIEPPGGGIGDGWMRLMKFDLSSRNPRVRVRTYSTHYKKFSTELPEYAAWYKPQENPDLTDAQFHARDDFTLELDGFRERFARASERITREERAEIDIAAREILKSTGAPSASIAVVRDGEIAYEQAYGQARIDPATAATPAMRYSIGSVSKQFTAAAVLMLVEEGKLSLDDKVARWFPKLTRAADVSVRQLLSMTSGYRDYYPQDYAWTDVHEPISPEDLAQRWTATLDFEPGTKWQYSNTNYVIAAGIVERVAGMPFMEFLRQRIFQPLKMTSVADIDRAPLGASDAAGYLRHALGPLKPAPKEAPGWLFGMGQLAMIPRDLALWDISVVDRSLLSVSSYGAQQTAVLLDSGNPANYGLGMEISGALDRRTLSHSGAVAGYTSHNRIFPDDRAAIVVFANIYPGAADAPALLADRISKVIFAADEKKSTEALQHSRKVYDGLRRGAVDRARLTASASNYFTRQVLSDYAASLPALTASDEFTQVRHLLRGGMSIRTYRIRANAVQMELVTMTLPDGRLDQYLITRVE